MQSARMCVSCKCRMHPSSPSLPPMILSKIGLVQMLSCSKIVRFLKMYRYLRHGLRTWGIQNVLNSLMQYKMKKITYSRNCSEPKVKEVFNQ